MEEKNKKSLFSAENFEKAMTETVEMTEIDGVEEDAVLCFTDIGKYGIPASEKNVQTCYGDLYVVVNALRDYSSLLERVIREWNLTGYQAAYYEMHATRCRKIAGKYAAAIGYDYDKALERCQKRRAKGERAGDFGVDGLEALVRRSSSPPPSGKKDGEK